LLTAAFYRTLCVADDLVATSDRVRAADGGQAVAALANLEHDALTS